MSWAVPVFLMITGVLLLKNEKTITYTVCIKKYCKRIVLALFVFGVPFSMLEIFMDSRKISVSMIADAVVNVITGKSWTHLWYLYALIGIYLILPVIKSFTDHCGRRTQGYFLIILFLFNFVIPFLNRILHITIGFEIPVSSYTVFYLVLGHYLDEEMPGLLKKRWFSVCLILGCAVTTIAVNSLIYPEGNADLGSGSMLSAIEAVAVFSLVYTFTFRQNTYIWSVDRLCFGVYLVHPVFINFTYKFLKITPLSFRWYALAGIVVWLSFVICSFFAAKILYSIPVFRKYIL
jgi:surface polysaccharide O-acyltransferase-like enzyme